MPSSVTSILFVGELKGFAKSRVMTVLWLLLPAVATAAYFLLPTGQEVDAGIGGAKMPMSSFMGLLLASIAGTIAAVMLAVDIVSEKSRKVYELLIVRPVPPGAILWAKFFAVFVCVTIACLLSLGLGLVVDLARGVALPPNTCQDMLQSMATLTGVIAMSSAVGIFFGVLSRSMLVAVILVLYVGQNLTIVPMLPAYLGFLPNLLWLALLISACLTIGLMLLAVLIFRRAEY